MPNNYVIVDRWSEDEKVEALRAIFNNADLKARMEYFFAHWLAKNDGSLYGRRGTRINIRQELLNRNIARDKFEAGELSKIIMDYVVTFVKGACPDQEPQWKGDLAPDNYEKAERAMHIASLKKKIFPK